MTDKIYDNKEKAMAAAEESMRELRKIIDCNTRARTEKNVVIVTIGSDKNGYADVATFRFKTAPTAGARGYAWNGDGPRTVNAPTYVATGEAGSSGTEVFNSSGGRYYVDHFDPVETDTEMETAVGRIVDWLGGSEACLCIPCIDCPAGSGDNAECRAVQIANLLKIARGEE